jgi:hypothetical protein
VLILGFGADLPVNSRLIWIHYMYKCIAGWVLLKLGHACGVSSVATEFMVDVAGWVLLKLGHACGVISVATEFMVDVAGWV